MLFIDGIIIFSWFSPVVLITAAPECKQLIKQILPNPVQGARAQSCGKKKQIGFDHVIKLL